MFLPSRVLRVTVPLAALCSVPVMPSRSERSRPFSEVRDVEFVRRLAVRFGAVSKPSILIAKRFPCSGLYEWMACISLH